jgi:hypothetical protein
MTLTGLYYPRSDNGPQSLTPNVLHQPRPRANPLLLHGAAKGLRKHVSVPRAQADKAIITAMRYAPLHLDLIARLLLIALRALHRRRARSDRSYWI